MASKETLELIVLNEKLQNIAIIDSYKSLLWIDRYNICGDFEIYTSAKSKINNYLIKEYYIYNPDSEHLMIIDGTELTTDIEEGDMKIITGRSLESILDRRIIWNQTEIKGNLQDGIKKLLEENLIFPNEAIEDQPRKIDNFEFEYSDDPNITRLSYEGQFMGENLYDTICEICKNEKLGWKINWRQSDNKFIIKLYFGKDRSYNQTENPTVIFSPYYDNLLSSDFIDNNKTYKNVTLVGGEGEGASQKKFEYGEGIGMNRREIYTDAKSVSSDGSTSDYNNLLKEKGITALNENQITNTFEGTISELGIFIINRDYFIGDLIQLENEYDKREVARVTEMIFSKDNEGYKIYPTYEVEEKSEEYTIKYDMNDGGTLGSCAPTKSRYDSSFIVSIPTKNNANFIGWNITGMDDIEHIYGDDENNNIKSTATELSNIRKIWFKNLRASQGEVVFKAVWGSDPTQYGDVIIQYTGIDYQTDWDNTKTVFKPLTMHYGTGYYISNPYRVGSIFTGWKITGMDNSEHILGTNKTQNIISNEDTILSTKLIWFKNLRMTTGTVTFEAQWEVI